MDNNQQTSYLKNSLFKRHRRRLGTKLTIEEIKKRAQKTGWALLTNVYKDSKTEIKLKCNKGHKFELYLNNIKVFGIC